MGDYGQVKLMKIWQYPHHFCGYWIGKPVYFPAFFLFQIRYRDLGSDIPNPVCRIQSRSLPTVNRLSTVSKAVQGEISSKSTQLPTQRDAMSYELQRTTQCHKPLVEDDDYNKALHCYQ